MTIEAMKQALEAFEWNLHTDLDDIRACEQWAKMLKKNITNLRAAIEQAELIQRAEEAFAASEQAEKPNEDYERGFVDGMQEQMKRSVDRAVNAMCKREETPFVWYHPVSGRFRFDGDKLPPSWIPLYK
jgi:hypothetical protein